VIDWASLEGAWLARTLAFGAALSFALYSLATAARGRETSMRRRSRAASSRHSSAPSPFMAGPAYGNSLSDAALALVLMP